MIKVMYSSSFKSKDKITVTCPPYIVFLSTSWDQLTKAAETFTYLSVTFTEFIITTGGHDYVGSGIY